MAKKIFTVENRKGGVGKTTTATALAVGLGAKCQAFSGGNVLLVDLDPQGDAARNLGIPVPKDICVSNVLLGDGSVDLLKKNIISASSSAEDGPKRPNVWIMPATDRLQKCKQAIIAEIAMSSFQSAMDGRQMDAGDVMVTWLDRKLGKLKPVFDYIVIDCPPTLDVLQQAVHQFADSAIVPVKLDYHGMSATKNHVDNIMADQAAGISIKIEKVVPTFVDTRLNLTKDAIQQLSKVYRGNTLSLSIPNTVRIAEAPALSGQTIFEYEPTSMAAKAYKHLVDSLWIA